MSSDSSEKREAPEQPALHEHLKRLARFALVDDVAAPWGLRLPAKGPSNLAEPEHA